ncbi:hypothetical protein CVT26_006653 [Gymnopilus dilepis]|uniref:F-box domain-containing protein n=1 Tax=Gymnopilus dilepis TaxID=231916 RepID=A0A409Y2R7_9AGAR|nr:hypothetical protein CVT26_006653 [Gymnopilus dilepis]
MQSEAVSSQSDVISAFSHPPTDQTISQDALSLASPCSFDSLPVEIASTIFIHYTHSDFDETQKPRPSLRLGKICKRWRQIAWSTPDLWTNLTIHPEHVTSRTHIELAEEWLSRSGTLPLWIFCSSPFFDEKEPEQALYSEMLEVFSRYSDRWYSLSLYLPFSCLIGKLSISSHPPLMLRYLSLVARWLNHDAAYVLDRPSVSAFSIFSPKVVKIAYLRVALDLTSVTVLDLALVDIVDVLLIFRAASNLSKCALTRVSDNDLDISPATKYGGVVCPVLISLSVSFINDWLLDPPTRAFCSSISLPALKHLSLEGCGLGTTEVPIEDLVLLLTQSSCALESLVINNSLYDQASFIRLAPFLSSLTALRISCHLSNQVNREDVETFGHFLANASQVPTLSRPFISSVTEPPLPFLETFVWEGHGTYPWETIVGLLKPASASGVTHYRPLKLVKIYCTQAEGIFVPYISKDVIQQLMEFGDVKFDFKLKCGRSDLNWASRMKAIFPQSDSGDLTDCTQSCQSATHPLNLASRGSFDSLPVEIASIVFMHYIHSCYEPQEEKEPHRSLMLGKISRRWRQIAWSTPNLWTQLTIHPRHATSQTHVELAEEWLSRSGALPLWIVCISRCFHDEEPGRALYGQMLEVFSRYSDRWYSLSLCMDFLPLKELGILPRSPSMLHHLSLEAEWSSHDHSYVLHHPKITAFSNCSPKNVTIRCLTVALDWTLVTELTLDLVDISEVLAVLESAPNVFTCTLEEVSYQGANILPIRTHGVVICPLLESLTISFADDFLSATEIFCSRVSLPALKHLSLEGNDLRTEELPVDNLLFFLKQSSCSLESLVVKRSMYDQASLIRLAPLLSSLSVLRISLHYSNQVDRDNVETFGHFLANASQVPTHSLLFTSSITRPPLPSLETFIWEAYGTFPWETIVGLLKPVSVSGAAHYRPLKFVKIYCTQVEGIFIPYISKDVIQRLMEFSDVKFDFKVESFQPKLGVIDWWKESIEVMNEA